MHRLFLHTGRIRVNRRYLIGATLVAIAFAVVSQTVLQVKASGVTVRAANSFVDSIGVVTHLRYLDTAYARYDEVIKPRLRELGVRHIRDGGKDGVMFQRLNDLAQVGIKATLVMDLRDGITPANVIGEVVNPVRAAIEAVEGPNEWDVQRQLTYQGQAFPLGVRAYQTELYNAIKGNANTAVLPVLMPSLAIPFNAPELGFMNELDAGNMHSYAGGNVPSQDLDTRWIPLTRVVAGNEKPIVATETGWHNAIADPQPSQPAISELSAAKYISRLFLEYFNRAIQRTFVYELIDERPAPDYENNFGLLRADGTPKPAFTGLKNLITLLNDPGATFQPRSLTYQLSGNVSSIHQTVLQKRNGQFYVLLWQEVPSFDLQRKQDVVVPEQTITLMLGDRFRQAKIFRPLNSLSPLTQINNPTQLQIRVPDHPVAIELTPA